MIKISKQKVIIYLLGLSISACTSMSGMPGYTGSYESKVDNIKTIYMEGAWIYDSYMKIGLRHNSKMDRDKIIMEVSMQGLVDIPSGNSLVMLLDGERISLSAMGDRNDYSTNSGYAGGGVYIPPSNWTGRSYKVTKALIKKMLSAKEGYIKIKTTSGYREGPIHKGGPTTFKSSADVFLKKLEKFR